jgi:hypothetical protein
MSPRRSERRIEGGWEVTITPPAFIAQSKPATVRLTEDQHERMMKWLAGALIQDCLPELSSEDREKLMTGLVDYGEL